MSTASQTQMKSGEATAKKRVSLSNVSWLKRGSKYEETAASNHKKNAPKQSMWTNQEWKDLRVRLTEKRSALLLFLLVIIFIPIGHTLVGVTDSVYEMTKVYDSGSGGSTVDVKDCDIKKPGEGKVCDITFRLDKDVDGPIYVYYQLRNFYQNHRRYVSSRNDQQLMGEAHKKSDVELSCSPLVELSNDNDDDTKLLNPCGLMANTMFNDKIELLTEGLNMKEDGIILKTDKDLFKQPKGFKSRTMKDEDDCSASPCREDESCYQDPTDDTVYCFKYPDASKTQYLYETYGTDIISPIKGVEDEHFIVWMRSAGLPAFRNLYGVIHEDLKKGDTLTFQVTNNFEVQSFDGAKALLITTVGLYGGANPFLGGAFMVVGGLSVTLFALLVAKLIFKYLQYARKQRN